ncbi:MAG TPA: S8 family serine peptidase [Coriobacteriia bacterium]|jgi:subtilisin family serine protease/putative cell wall-binding protein
MNARSASTRLLHAAIALAFASSGLLPALPSPAFGATAAATRIPSAIASRQPRQVVVKWAPGVQPAQISAAADRLGFKVVRESRKLGWSLVAPARAGVTPTTLLDALRRAGLTRQAHLERFYSVQGLPAPNDPLYVQQWALHNTGQTGGTAGADISAPKAWSRTTGSRNVVVAVVDTGIDWTHTDLRANVWTNSREIPGNGIDDDRNGFVDDVHGYDFGNGDASLYDAQDGDQHGTHVAGIIGAAGNNATGVAGVNWNVTIMPVKFLVQGSGTDFDGAEAIHYAVDNGADVINCSWGGSEPSDLLDEAFRYAAQHGVLTVTASGNDSANVDETPFYPGCIDSTAIVNVAATDHNDALSDFSNYGKAVDIAAPGVDVTSTLPYECAGVYTDKFPYRVMYLAFPAEAVEPAATRDRLITRSVSQLSPMTGAVLVVDDSSPNLMAEVPGVRLGTYVSALHAVGYSDVATWSTETQGVPGATEMNGRTVVWFTGVVPADTSLGPILSAPERAALGTFLDSGGRLLISGGDIASGLMWTDPAWLEQYLHAGFTAERTWGADLKGFADAPFEGLTGGLAEAYRGDRVYAYTGSDSIFALDGFAKPVVGLGGYGPLSGTSMAAPQVTGSAALLMAAFPKATAEDVRDRLLGTVDTKPGLTDVTALGGRLNVWTAMNDFPGRPVITQPRTGEILRAGRTQRLAWTTSQASSASATFEAELGLPVQTFAAGFEDGTLGAFSTDAAGGWTTTSTAHTGSYGIRSGPGLSTQSSTWVTVTVPPTGGDASFWYWFDGDPWMAFGLMSVDTTDGVVWGSGDPTGWQQVSVRLPAGTHRLIWTFDDYSGSAGGNGFGFDDVSVTGFDFQPLAATAAGVREATFTVPATDTPHARLRVRSHLGAMTSAWSDQTDVRISTDLTPPASPGAFHAIPGTDGDVTLSWTNPAAGEGARVRVLRRFDVNPAGPNDPAAEVVYEGTVLTHRDLGMAAGDVARYAAYAIDPAENPSTGVFASAVVSDVTPPQAIRGLQAGMTQGVVGLVWFAPPPAECSSVRLLRRTDTTPTGPTDASATVVYEGSASFARDYLLTSRPFAGTAYYAIFPFDPSGNVGPRSAVRIAVDSGGLRGTFALNGGAVFSTSSTVTAASSVPRAVRMRFNLGDTWGAWQPYAASTPLVLQPRLDGLHVVQAEYEDATGQRLTLTASIFLEFAGPSTPTELRAQGWNRRVKLTWKPAPEADVTGYKVYGGTSAAGPYRVLASAEPSSAEGFVVDAPVAYGFFKVTAFDVAGFESARSAPVTGTPGPGVTRVAGPDRYATAVQVSRRHFTSADTVVLATGENFADALGASGLAGSYSAPILLTKRDSLPEVVAAEIRRLGATHVFVIGGTSAISSAVQSQLAASYTVKRVFGADRYATAAEVARELSAHETTPASAAILVNGMSFADGTSIGAVAYATRMPVLMTRSTSLPAPTADMIARLGVKSVYIIGGPAAVSFDVEDSLPVPADRIGGSNRYETSAMIAETFASEGLVNLEYVAVASGRSYPDALAGGPAAGKEGGVVVLTDPSFPADATFEMFSLHSLEMDRVEVLGSASAVDDVVPEILQEMLDQGGPLVPGEGPGGPGAFLPGGP